VESTRGVRVIIAYKAVKSVVQIALAAALPALGRAGVIVHAMRFTASLARHGAALVTSDRLRLVALALAFDGSVSAFEGWALYRRFRWAPYLVIIAAATLIPFEILELCRRPRWSRVLILLVNGWIVAYLALRARREHAARA
jgi:uncharacterized membrane protein (DUF2068 family)